MSNFLNDQRENIDHMLITASKVACIGVLEMQEKIMYEDNMIDRLNDLKSIQPPWIAKLGASQLGETYLSRPSSTFFRVATGEDKSRIVRLNINSSICNIMWTGHNSEGFPSALEGFPDGDYMAFMERKLSNYNPIDMTLPIVESNYNLTDMALPIVESDHPLHESITAWMKKYDKTVTRTIACESMRGMLKKVNTHLQLKAIWPDAFKFYETFNLHRRGWKQNAMPMPDANSRARGVDENLVRIAKGAHSTLKATLTATQLYLTAKKCFDGQGRLSLYQHNEAGLNRLGFTHAVRMNVVTTCNKRCIYG